MTLYLQVYTLARSLIPSYLPSFGRSHIGSRCERAGGIRRRYENVLRQECVCVCVHVCEEANKYHTPQGASFCGYQGVF